MNFRRFRSMLSCTLPCAALFIAFPDAASADPPVTCGDSYSGRGELSGDCTGDISVRGGSLNLRGFTVRGSVRCEGDLCEVFSDPPEGAISGGGDWAAAGIDGGAASVTVDGITITGFGTGIAAGTVRASDMVIAGNAGHGIDARDRIELTNSVVTLNGHDGLRARIGSVSIAGSEITGNQGSGIRALKGVLVTGSSVLGSGADGVRNFSGAVLVEDSTISGSGEHGVRTDDSDCDPTGVLELRDSTIEGNALDPSCGETRACADVVSCGFARVSGSSRCESSYRIQSGLPGESWRVCSSD
jgi:hypothetical protein